MTPQDWKEVEKSLKSFYSAVNLMCDGYKVTLLLGPISQFKNALLVYIGGEIRGKWLREDCEERRRFFRSVTKSICSPKEKKAWKKLSKKTRLELEAMTRYTSYYSYWTSFRALKSHLIKNNSEIELVREQKPKADKTS